MRSAEHVAMLGCAQHGGTRPVEGTHGRNSWVSQRARWEKTEKLAGSTMIGEDDGTEILHTVWNSSGIFASTKVVFLLPQFSKSFGSACKVPGRVAVTRS